MPAAPFVGPQRTHLSLVLVTPFLCHASTLHPQKYEDKHDYEEKKGRYYKGKGEVFMGKWQHGIAVPPINCQCVHSDSWSHYLQAKVLDFCSKHPTPTITNTIMMYTCQ